MDAASIEQMNKVRVSLGMAPLPVPGKDAGPQFKAAADDSGSESDDMSTLDKRQAAAGSNWQKLEDERREKAEREKRKSAAKKARDASQRYAKMEGKGLGEAEEEEMDTRSWLLSQKKRQKKIEKARKMEEELAAREKEAMQEYTSKDLAGVKVGHEADEFDETTGEQVLTLKDTAIGEESEDDELENTDMKAKEKLEANLKLKLKKPDYDPMDQDNEKAVLSKYDEEIDGKKAKRFTLDGQGSSLEARRKLDGEGEVKSKGVKISLDMLKDDEPANDYVDASTTKVRKPKKKKEKKARQKEVDEDDIFPAAPAPQPSADAMEVDGAPALPSKKRALEFDDDDLQAKLAEQRREALKKRKKMDASELARQMRDEMPVDDEEPEEGGLVMDETSEFVANLKPPEAPEVRTSKTPQPATAGSPDAEDADEDGDTAMGYGEAAEAEERAPAASTEAPDDHTTTGLEEEATFSSVGTGAALSMLRKRNVLADSADSDLSEKDRKRMKFLADKEALYKEFDERAKSDRAAERNNPAGKTDRRSKQEQEEAARRQNEAREHYVSQKLNEMFRVGYRPDVKLAYYDEGGRSMDQKEAFKHMSHAFHGKGSGKGKQDKKLKKIEEEKRREAKMTMGAGEGGFVGVQGVTPGRARTNITGHAAVFGM
ncbi:hypothetical protein LTR56_006321 [Elasticomyces elasticus]|nr:hypothetical protein LTR56_006321 [Elasticomyces elasticus]KAK3663369.1 hypothetical protein LTR22_005776 [Elasticomyces elasticus]KAK4925448.1 hypothetical protein LTR49_007512 [Elasticomyces elasticus]KAK5764543.1 hypothetical protein LTS12_005273 [Elasticomyces elasticus]